MTTNKLVDIVLKELVTTRHPSISIRRILQKHQHPFTDELISEIDDILCSKSLVQKKDTDSQGYPCYAITGTGQDFLKSFGSYSKYLKGAVRESRRVERTKNKKPYVAKAVTESESIDQFQQRDKSFFEQNLAGILVLVLVIVLFVLIIRLN